MSLSSQYLEELSRRYKKQVEEMQRLLDKTITTFSEESRKREEKSVKLEEQIATLTSIVDTLVVEKNTWMNVTYWLFLIIIATIGLLTFCRRNPEFRRSVVEPPKNAEVSEFKNLMKLHFLLSYIEQWLPKTFIIWHLFYGGINFI